MLRNLFRSVRALLALPARLSREVGSLDQGMQQVSQRLAKRQDAQQRDLLQTVERLKGKIAGVRDELDRHFAQQHLQMSRVTALLEGRAEPPTMMSERAPLAVSDSAPLIQPRAAFSDEDWLTLARCPVCGTADRTVVCEWNKLILLDTAPDERSRRYDYALCHGCGLLYATERPVGARYQYLMAHFGDVIEKNMSNPLLNPDPLTPDDEERYRRLLAAGVFVSDHRWVEHLDGVFKDRLENAAHVDLLGSLLDLRGARVLEVRSRAGTIVEAIRRLYGADVYAMPIFESQGFVVRELYGIPTSAPIDFDRFTIPFDGPFDLIACNHMLTHAVRPGDFLAAIKGALRSGGYLYLYNEINESEFLDHPQSMLATMNPLHLQTSDRLSLARALNASGFETVFVKGHRQRNICLARYTGETAWQPMPERERTKRVARYQLARDRAVLRAPEPVRPRFADVWHSTVERAVTSGLAVFDERGAVRLVKK